ncbi:hypothetical protein [Microbacterium sp. PA5]|uniref:hypothetical protein n=1 Tax=Microbacterium sp. PA5 TaxID=3416654 RepID=UPI003CF22C03
MDVAAATTSPRRGSAPHLLGLLYVVLLGAAGAAGIAASFATSSGMGCPDATTTAAVILSCVAMAVVPAVSLLPRVRARIHRAYRIVALVLPITALVIYGTIMIAAAMFSAYGERPGSWSGLLMPIVHLAPLATLVGAGALAALATKRRKTLYVGMGALVVAIAALVTVVAVIRSLTLCV